MLSKVLALLGIEAGRELTTREAAVSSAFYVAAAMVFAAGMFFLRGANPALEFLTGYLLEKALSVDNLFVFMILFSMFGVSGAAQRRILSLGILGALVLRGAMIGAGTALLHVIPAVSYLFGGFLIYTGYRLAAERESEGFDPRSNPLVRLAKRLLPVADESEGEALVVRRAGKLVMTRLLLVLAVVEITDLMFAVDSIPAVLAITQDPFIVFTSNAFAVLGLRALYFVVVGLLDRLRYLRQALAGILAFVGLKMLLADVYEVPVLISLAVTVLALAVAVMLSRATGAASRSDAAVSGVS